MRVVPLFLILRPEVLLILYVLVFLKINALIEARSCCLQDKVSANLWARLNIPTLILFVKTLLPVKQTANLAETNASEEDKIKAMMSQSNHDYDPIQ